MAEDATSSAAVVARPKKMVKRPPARKQVEIGQVEKKAPEQTGSTFNVWYGKWAGGDKYDSYNVKEKSQTRVSIKKDSGYTRADGGGNAYLCLFFARGCCPYGHECSFLHRLPRASHLLPDSALDVFGREKHSDYRDDMGGVGSFSRMNRTLYVGRITETRDTADMIERHFEEFGEIERIKILQSRGVAFVTYVTELHAQFAKEAMMHQSLDSDEVLNVRWATEDPNPAAARAEHKRLVAEGEAGIARSLDPDFVQAVREMDEFEGKVEPRAPSPPPPQPEEEEQEEPRAKRARIEPPVEEKEEETKPQGLLSANAIDSLRYMASLRQQQTKTAPVVATKPVVNALGSLADYGSDEDSD